MTTREDREDPGHPQRRASAQALKRRSWTAEISRAPRRRTTRSGTGAATPGARGDELDSGARVLAIADIYEALTADRPYRAGMRPEAALAIPHRDRGTRLCADAVDALESHLGVAAGSGKG